MLATRWVPSRPGFQHLHQRPKSWRRLVNASASTSYQHRQSQNNELEFRELMHCRIQLITAMCPAWAHRYQTMCLFCSSMFLRPTDFRLLKPKAKFRELPSCRSMTRLVGAGCEGCGVFTDDGTKKSPRATLPDVETRCCPRLVISWCFLDASFVVWGARLLMEQLPSLTNTAESNGFTEPLKVILRRDITSPLSPGASVRCCRVSEHDARIALGVTHAGRSVVQSNASHNLLLQAKNSVLLSTHHVHRHVWLCWQRLS